MPASPKLTTLLQKLIDSAPLKQHEIAARCGFSSANMIAMLKSGRTRLPIDKVEPFAEAVGYDAKLLMRLVINEYHPTWLGPLERCLGSCA